MSVMDTDVLADYVRPCGCADSTMCGHLEGMRPSELRQIDDFAHLLLGEANQLLQWLRHEANAGRTYTPHDSELLLEQLRKLR
jgi:hypothetical protein